MSERWHRLKSVFQAALDEDETRRSAFLDAECGADTDLRRQVEVLLSSYQQAPSFLETPAMGRLPDAPSVPDGSKATASDRTKSGHSSAKAGWGSSTRPPGWTTSSGSAWRSRSSSAEWIPRGRAAPLPARAPDARVTRPSRASPRFSTAAPPLKAFPTSSWSSSKGSRSTSIATSRRWRIVERLKLFRADLRGGSVRPPESGRPSRHQARQHPRDQRRPAQARGLRHRKGARPGSRRSRRRS